MRPPLRFLVPLLLVLALLAWGAAGALNAVSRRWFERDVDLRAQLAVHGAREGLARHWQRGDRAAVARALLAITRDERIMAAAACGADLTPIASTPDYPAQFACGAVGTRLGGPAPALDLDDERGWGTSTASAGGRVHVNAIAVEDEGQRLGFVTLVHDLAYVDRREARTRTIAFGAFALLALAAAVATILMARFSWRAWTRELQRLLTGRSHRPEFQPLAHDLRELVSRLMADAHVGQGGAWDADRLRRTLTRHLQGEKVVIVANREPYIHERGADGRIKVVHPASGLVTALEPVMRACSGVWVAHGSGSADRETADRNARVAVPPGEESYRLRRVWLSQAEEAGYYYGFSNEGLWPLCHLAHTRPTFRADDWVHYRDVNRKFADAVCQEVDVDDPIIFVQDYHFALLPGMLRKRLPRATILAFWHIPWPNSEQFSTCPWHDELMEGLLGASILGFHTQFHCNNFLDAVDRFLEARIDREQQGIAYGGRMTLVRPYPISIEWPSRWLAAAPSVAECRASVLAEHGIAPGVMLGVGVDRLDYTKGIEERLLTVERMLERFPHLRGRFTFLQLAAPSRTSIPRYQELNDGVDRLATRINARFASGTWRPIVLARQHHEPPTVFRYYRAGDLCYVSSLHDGMNLVAKEYVAARDDERGVLLLSCFTGAARELTEALVVNPYDLEEASAAMAAALAMPPEEQQTRMRSMRLLLSEYNVYRWAGRILVDAARLRERDRLSGRLITELRPAHGGVG